ncbi:hypothetical protein MSGX11T_02891 [Mycoplasma synoviae GX11-T]|uniref:hypothetical protein n=1 Tax=Mycoplasmopsis synoviae TaxID=2109 RepID=UPI00174D27A0|nr:hypothetical protein [Mycoplasmopsis synoviae]MBD5788942.1 hypothetical protein [Mycoplasmopsis synoviae GX11-T]
MSNVNIKNNNYDKNYLIENERFLSRQISKIVSLDFDRSENIAFNDIANSFSKKNSGIKHIVNFCDNIYNLNLDYLLILTPSDLKISILACLDFVLGKQDFNEDKKIKFIFIDESESSSSIDEKIDYFFEKVRDNRVGLLFIDEIVKNEKLKKVGQNLIIKFNKFSSHFIVKKYLFYVGKRSLFSQNYENLNLLKENILFSSEDIHNDYNIFSENVLIFLALKGINISKLIDGYEIEVNKIFFKTSEMPKSLDLAVSLYEARNELFVEEDTQKIFFVAYDDFLINISKLFSIKYQKLLSKYRAFCDYLHFPRQIYSVGQIVLNGAKNIFMIYLTINNKIFDFQFSSNLNDNYGQDFENYTLNEMKRHSKDVFDNNFLSLNPSSKSIEINLENNKEQTLGELLAILYWSKIFYSMISSQKAF